MDVVVKRFSFIAQRRRRLRTSRYSSQPRVNTTALPSLVCRASTARPYRAAAPCSPTAYAPATRPAPQHSVGFHGVSGGNRCAQGESYKKPSQLLL